MPPPQNLRQVQSFFGRLNYISRFIAQLTHTCEPLFKLLRKNTSMEWTPECDEAFQKIKKDLINPSYRRNQAGHYFFIYP